MDRAEQISDEDIKIGMQTDQEYITFIAENTFVDGKSLKEVYPQIEEFLAYYRDSESAIDDKYFNFDAFRMTPRALGKRSGYIDAEGVYHPNQAMADGWEDSGDESEEDGESDGDVDAGEDAGGDEDDDDDDDDGEEEEEEEEEEEDEEDDNDDDMNAT